MSMTRSSVNGLIQTQLSNPHTGELIRVKTISCILGDYQNFFQSYEFNHLIVGSNSLAGKQL